MKAVIHLHTFFSFDSMTAPKAIVDKAIEHKIDVLCITDHDTVEGSIKAFEYAKTQYNEAIKIVIGAEFSTDWGDIIGINIKENIDSNSFYVQNFTTGCVFLSERTRQWISDYTYLQHLEP